MAKKTEAELWDAIEYAEGQLRGVNVLRAQVKAAHRRLDDLVEHRAALTEPQEESSGVGEGETCPTCGSDDPRIVVAPRRKDGTPARFIWTDASILADSRRAHWHCPDRFHVFAGRATPEPQQEEDGGAALEYKGEDRPFELAAREAVGDCLFGGDLVWDDGEALVYNGPGEERLINELARDALTAAFKHLLPATGQEVDDVGEADRKGAFFGCGDFDWKVGEEDVLVSVIGDRKGEPVVETRFAADPQRLADLLRGAAWAQEQLATTSPPVLSEQAKQGDSGPTREEFKQALEVMALASFEGPPLPDDLTSNEYERHGWLKTGRDEMGEGFCHLTPEGEKLIETVLAEAWIVPASEQGEAGK